MICSSLNYRQEYDTTVFNIDNFKIEYTKSFVYGLYREYSYIDNYVIYYRFFNRYIKLCDINIFTYDKNIKDNISYNEFTHLISGYTYNISNNENYSFNDYYGMYLIYSKLYYYVSKLKRLFKFKNNKIELGYE